MCQTLSISSREQVTLRAILPELEMYSSKQVTAWDQQDQLSATQRKVLLKRLLKCVPKAAPKSDNKRN